MTANRHRVRFASETFRDGDTHPRALNLTYVRHVLFTRGASRGRFEAEQDAAPARVFRKHTLGRLGSPSEPTTWLCRSRLDADRMKAEKPRRIKTHRVRPVPEVRSSRPKSPPNSSQACADCVNLSAERREAMLPDHIVSQAMPGAKQTQGALYGAPCPSLLRGD